MLSPAGAQPGWTLTRNWAPALWGAPGAGGPGGWKQAAPVRGYGGLGSGCGLGWPAPQPGSPHSRAGHLCHWLGRPQDPWRSSSQASTQPAGCRAGSLGRAKALSSWPPRLVQQQHHIILSSHQARGGAPGDTHRPPPQHSSHAAGSGHLPESHLSWRPATGPWEDTEAADRSCGS